MLENTQDIELEAALTAYKSKVQQVPSSKEDSYVRAVC